MIALAYAALFGIPLLAAAWVFWQRGSTSAVAHALVFGWLSMPLLVVEIAGLPEVQKELLLAPAILIAAWISRRRQGQAIVPCWLDLPMVALCISSLVSSMTNDLGPVDGLKQAFTTTAYFGAPWLLGRMVFTDGAAVVALGRALLRGAAAYAPFCLAESRLAPQLHQWIFGIPGRVGWETVDFYGPLRFKASVFLQSPLELTPLMGAGVIFGWWSLRRLPVGSPERRRTMQLVVLATISMLMGKSLGGVSLTVLGCIVIAGTAALRARVLVWGLLAIVPLYVSTRASGAWDALSFVSFVRENVSERRAESFQVRVDNENLLVQKALERPWFGWAGWGRSRVLDEYGKDISITDGFWVILLGTKGWFGLGSWMLALLLPVAMALWKRWRLVIGHPAASVMLCAMVVPLLHAIDCLANGMVNPCYYLLAGGVLSFYQSSLLHRRATTLLLEPLAERLGGRTLTPRPAPLPGRSRG